MNAGLFKVRLYPEKPAAVDPPLRVIRPSFRIEQGEAIGHEDVGCNVLDGNDVRIEAEIGVGLNDG